jgi:hypothetical protein
MRRLLLIPFLLALSACGGTTDGPRPGGPVTPSSIPIGLGPSAHTAGNTMPTGIVVDGKELVLFLWQLSSGEPVLAQAVRDTATGSVDIDAGVCVDGRGSDDRPPFIDLVQCGLADGSIVEYGAVRSEAARITSQADGTTTEAWFARWTVDTVTVFWLRRHGTLAPQNVANGPGRTTPLPPEQYPLITVYDAKGKVVASARIRPGAVDQTV